jgi:hypothetical protein
MIDFSQRIHRAELMDDPALAGAELQRNLDELERINRRLGGYQTLRAGLDWVYRKGGFPGDRPAEVIDLGSGAGDNLREMGHWFQRRGLPVRLTGLDFHPFMLSEARRRLGADWMGNWLQGDALEADYRPFDWATASLFCHHLDDEQLSALVARLRQAGTGLIVNDLHRHPLAYAGIWSLTRLFPASYLVRNDGPLSVRRAFRRADWQHLLQRAGVASYRLWWRWAFRWLLVVPPAGPQT